MESKCVLMCCYAVHQTASRADRYNGGFLFIDATGTTNPIIRRKK